MRERGVLHLSPLPLTYQARDSFNTKYPYPDALDPRMVTINSITSHGWKDADIVDMVHIVALYFNTVVWLIGRAVIWSQRGAGSP